MRKNMGIQINYLENRNTEFYKNEIYKKLRKFLFLQFYECFIILKYYGNTGKIAVLWKYEKREFHNIDAWRQCYKKS